MRKKLGKVLQVQKIVVPLQPQSREKATKQTKWFSWLEYMPVTHGVTGSSPVRTAINIENQCFTK